MSKDSLQIKEISGKTLGFSEFWQTIASELGNSRLKVNPCADSIRYFLDAESDHRDFLRNIIHQSYKRCRCYHLKARFDVNIALDVLGETSFSLQGTKEDDLLDIELLEEIAWLINQRYKHLIEMPDSMLIDCNQSLNGSIIERPYGDANQSNSSYAAKRTSPVLSMSNIKIMRANRQL